MPIRTATYSGASYVVFGKASGFAANLDLVDARRQQRLQAQRRAACDNSGISVAAAGDVNGDGFADLIVGAPGADAHGSDSGASYVVFGKASGFAANLDSRALDGSNGFKLSGAAAGDQQRLLGRRGRRRQRRRLRRPDRRRLRADPHGDLCRRELCGLRHRRGFAANLDLAALDGSERLQAQRRAAYDYSGFSVAAAGDVNGDGIDDLIVGAPDADPHGIHSGASYVVFGTARASPRASISSRSTAATASSSAARRRSTTAGISVAVGRRRQRRRHRRPDRRRPGADAHGDRCRRELCRLRHRRRLRGEPRPLARSTAANGFRLDGAAADDQQRLLGRRGRRRQRRRHRRPDRRAPATPTPQRHAIPARATWCSARCPTGVSTGRGIDASKTLAGGDSTTRFRASAATTGSTATAATTLSSAAAALATCNVRRRATAHLTVGDSARRLRPTAPIPSTASSSSVSDTTSRPRAPPSTSRRSMAPTGFRLERRGGVRLQRRLGRLPATSTATASPT